MEQRELRKTVVKTFVSCQISWAGFVIFLLSLQGLLLLLQAFCFPEKPEASPRGAPNIEMATVDTQSKGRWMDDEIDR